MFFTSGDYFNIEGHPGWDSKHRADVQFNTTHASF